MLVQSRFLPRVDEADLLIGSDMGDSINMARSSIQTIATNRRALAMGFNGSLPKTAPLSNNRTPINMPSSHQLALLVVSQCARLVLASLKVQTAMATVRAATRQLKPLPFRMSRSVTNPPTKRAPSHLPSPK